jgi:hypothetical protein
MAVAFDAAGPSSAGKNQTTAVPITWTHTPAGTPSIVFAACATTLSGGTAPSAGTATYGGQAMTSLGQAQSGGVWTYGYIEAFVKVGPLSGAQTVSITPAYAGTYNGCEGGSVSYTGANADGTPATATSSGAATSGTAGVTGTSTSNVVVAFMTNGSGGQSITAGTSRFSNSGNVGTDAAGACFCADITSAAGSVSVAWTQTSDYWGAIVVEVQVGGTSTSPAWAASYDTTAVAGTGSWTNPANAEGAADGVFATWTAP